MLFPLSMISDKSPSLVKDLNLTVLLHKFIFFILHKKIRRNLDFN